MTDVRVPVCDDCGKNQHAMRVRWVGEAAKLICTKCMPAFRTRHPSEPNKTGPGIGRIRLTPEETAKRMARLHAGNLAYRERLKELKTKGLHEPDETLPVKVAGRWWTIMIMHLEGYDPAEIARALGYRKTDQVIRVLKKQIIADKIAAVKQAQLERVISGDFGVRAQAKAAAPKVMRTMTELAAGATKDADKIKAGQTVLTVAGEMVQRTETNHVHVMLKDLTDQELMQLRDRGVWPDRYKAMVEKLGLAGNGRLALPAPEE